MTTTIETDHDSAIPPSGVLPRVFLKPRKARPFFNHHPWVLDTAVDHVEGAPADGAVVDLCSERGAFIARGFYNSRSRIRVRLYSWQAADDMEADAFWRDRISAALEMRRQIGYDDAEGAARLVSSEADQLSGLIVERFAGHVVLQVTSLAVAAQLERIAGIVDELLKPASISVRATRETNKAEGLALEDATIRGTTPEGPVFFQEHGLRYGMTPVGGQKTGFYLDQRENRRAVAGYLAGRKVLDVCCYTGAFSLCASLLGQAREVRGIDSSAPAIELAKAHAELNGVINAQFEVADAFHALDACAEGAERFGAVILDPPKFAHHHRATAEALRAYHHLNRQAVRALEPGGILVSCSCSGHVSREDLLMMLADVARQTGRDVQILESRGASPDHPILASCLESEYLKCLICRVR